MKKTVLPISVSLFVAFLLTMVQWKVEGPMLLLERFLPGYGWVEVVAIALYGGFVAYKMQDVKLSAKWRLRTWFIFSIVFFSQLILGLFGVEECLMTGKLHLPVPAVILGGPAFRFELGFMPILFTSTILLSGPAWCSHLCYLGALDGLAAKNRKKPLRFEGFRKWKLPIFTLVILIAILFRILQFSIETAAIAAGAFGIVGVMIMLLYSRKQRAMTHCTVWCPVGTFINYTRFINPFRLNINDSSCTDCMVCTTHCRYDALNVEDIKNRKPGITCTLCGDCLSSCHSDAIEYKFFRLKPQQARNLWLFMSVNIHAVFMALARM